MFAASPVFSVVGSHLIIGESNRYSLRILDRMGNEVGRIERDVDVRSVDDRLQTLIRRALLGQIVDDPLVKQLGFDDGAAMDMLSEQVRQRMFDRLEFGETFPVVGTVIPGPGQTVLVQRSIGLIDEHTKSAGLEAETGEFWDVFEIVPTRYLGVLRMPLGFQPFGGLDGLVGGLQSDSLDVPVVRVIRIDPV